MILLPRLALCAASVLALAACTETMDSDTSMSGSTSGSMAASGAMRTGSSEDEAACMSAVAAQTGSSVMVMSSEFSEANTLVMVGVGPQRAPWRCLVSGGNVAEVMSMTNEGSL